MKILQQQNEPYFIWTESSKNVTLHDGKHDLKKDRWGMWNDKVKKTAQLLLVQPVVFQEKLGYRQVLRTGNNVCHCLWSNRQSWGNGWILGKRGGGGKAKKKKEKKERDEGQHVKAESVLSESHVHEPGVWVTGDTSLYDSYWRRLELNRSPFTHTHTNPSIKVMCAKYSNCLKIDKRTQVHTIAHACKNIQQLKRTLNHRSQGNIRNTLTSPPSEWGKW